MMQLFSDVSGLYDYGIRGDSVNLKENMLMHLPCGEKKQKKNLYHMDKKKGCFG